MGTEDEPMPRSRLKIYLVQTQIPRADRRPVLTDEILKMKRDETLTLRFNGDREVVGRRCLVTAGPGACRQLSLDLRRKRFDVLGRKRIFRSESASGIGCGGRGQRPDQQQRAHRRLQSKHPRAFPRDAAPASRGRSNRTPRRCSDFQMVRHGRDSWSDGTIKINRSGMPSRLSTSKSAPVALMLRTMQEIAAPPKEMLPAFRIRVRDDSLFSSTFRASVIRLFSRPARHARRCRRP